MGFDAAAILGAGFLLGMRHATDPDHVLAVSTLMSEERGLWPSMRLGVFWGLGHATTLVTASTLTAGLGLAMAGKAETLFESSVGAMLLGMGAMVMWRRDRPPRRAPVRASAKSGQTAVLSRPRSIRGRWSYAVGLVHGLAGSAALSLIAGAAAGSAGLAILFALLVGAGSLVGMMGVTLAFAAAIVPWDSDGVGRAFSFWVGPLSIGWALWIFAGVLA